MKLTKRILLILNSCNFYIRMDDIKNDFHLKGATQSCSLTMDYTITVKAAVGAVKSDGIQAFLGFICWV